MTFTATKKKRHWKQHRSAYSLAEFVMRKNGLDVIRDRVTKATGSKVDFDTAIIEHEVRFDSFGHGREHDLGMFGKTDSGQSVYVGVEAKVDESFGPAINDVFLDSKCKQLSGISTNAPERIEQLIKFNFDSVDRSKFSLRYQLLYATAGTLAVGADNSILYIITFKTPLYDEVIGAENFRDYLLFMNALKSDPLPSAEQWLDQREAVFGEKKLLCIYDQLSV